MIRATLKVIPRLPRPFLTMSMVRTALQIVQGYTFFSLTLQILLGSPKAEEQPNLICLASFLADTAVGYTVLECIDLCLLLSI